VGNRIIFMFLVAMIFKIDMAYALCSEESCTGCAAAIAAQVPQNSVVYFPTGSSSACCGQVINTSYTHMIVNTIVGPNARNDAIASVPSTGRSIVSKSCPGCANGDAGWVMQTTYTQVPGSCAKCDGTSKAILQTYYVYKYTIFVTGNCSIEPECYTVTGAASCSATEVSGHIIGFEVEKCDCETGELSGDVEICGDAEMYGKIKDNEVPGLWVMYMSKGCNLTESQKDELCGGMETGGTCEDLTDTDGDGILDNADYCETPAEELSIVDDIGCTKQGGGDDDGDGVPDELDNCTSPPGSAVNAVGCAIEQDAEVDTDGDGTPDVEDDCPGEAGNGANGCEIDNPQHDSDGDGTPDGNDQDYSGDGDNDNALLNGIIGWLKKVNSGVNDMDGHILGLGGKIDGLGDKIDDQGEAITGKIDEVGKKIDDLIGEGPENIDLPADEDFNADLPEDFEPVDLEENFLEGVFDDLISNNAFISQIRGSELTASGSCSLHSSVTIFNRSVDLDFSICDYDLSAFRAVVLMIAGLTSFFIVFRK